MERKTDVLIVGGGLGGVAAALAALRNGASVVLSEVTDWIGGQLTAQLVPPDEHRRIEHQGRSASYAMLRHGIRDYYRHWYPLTTAARLQRHLNPGAGWVSPICHEPRVAVAVLEAMLAPYRASGRLCLLLEHEPIDVDIDADRTRAVRLQSRRDGSGTIVNASYIVDATETGDLLPLAHVEHVTGRESRSQTGEPSAAETARPLDMQAATWCFAMEHRSGEDHTIDRPAGYSTFRDWRPPARRGRGMFDWHLSEDDGVEREYRLVVNPEDDPANIDVDHRNIPRDAELWTYRRIAARLNFVEGTYPSDVTVVNWPMNDYVGGPLYGVPDAVEHLAAARELSRSFLYWLQTEAPTPDGRVGYPGLRLRPDIADTPDGFAKMPYIRESRRIRAVSTIVEQDVSLAVRGVYGARQYPDSVGVGHYYWIDRHATTGGDPGGNGRPLPFEVPLSALIPQRVRGLLAAAKNIGTTHVTNGCYRLHPVEWAIGEAAGTVAAFSVARHVEPHQILEDEELLVQLQSLLMADGVQLRWEAGVSW